MKGSLVIKMIRSWEWTRKEKFVRRSSAPLLVSLVGLGIVACAGGDPGSSKPGSEGGTPGTGGSVGTGGTSGTGPAGGSVGTGGAAPTGGSGGATTGGSAGTASGGSAGNATGGTGTGGSSTGGSAGTATGGTGGKACTNVRPTGTEWDEATCDQWASETEECGNAWMINGNYCNESCGRCSSGTGGTGTGGTGTGGTGTGGTSAGGTSAGGTGTGGTGTGGTGVVIPDTCTEADRQVCNNLSGQHCGYTFEYWKDQGSGCLTNTSNGFNVQWTNVNNLLGRKGRRPGSRTQVVTYQADYRPDGNSYLCVYGWTRNPLVEYYIVDSWGDWRPPGGEPMGTVQSDGGTYEIYRTERVNAPSIDGTRTFYQYWSVRTEKRTSGTISVGNHFGAWERNSLPIGSLYEVSMTVEGYQSSGTANVAMVMQ
jgi:endo-1,4-beta-xylanase